MTWYCRHCEKEIGSKDMILIPTDDPGVRRSAHSECGEAELSLRFPVQNRREAK